MLINIHIQDGSIYIYIYIYRHHPVLLYVNFEKKRIRWKRRKKYYFTSYGSIDTTTINGILLGKNSYTFQKYFLPEEIEKRGHRSDLIPYECVSLVCETRTYDFVIPEHDQKIKFLLAVISLIKENGICNKVEVNKSQGLPTYFDIVVLQMKLKIEYMTILTKQSKILLYLVCLRLYLFVYMYRML